MNASNPKIYGKSPFHVCVIHGGPGAAGEMAPVATAIASGSGVLEPFQTADTVEGQIEELRILLEEHGTPPVTLIGYSWGAWLSWMTAAKHPKLVKKLILVSSGPFDEKYSKGIQKKRMDRLSEKERAEVKSLMLKIDESDETEVNDLFARFGVCISKADAYDPISEINDINCRFDVFQKVWPEASQMRESGKLLEMAERIKCPVTAIHGDYDPHPAEGVQKPLSKVLKDFRFILLEKCGHKPWIEKQACERFFTILREELKSSRRL